MISSPAELLRVRMKKTGWSAHDVADVVGCSCSTVRRLLNGQANVSIRLAPLLAAAFGDDSDVWIRARVEWLMKSIPEHERSAIAAGVRERLALFKRGVRYAMRFAVIAAAVRLKSAKRSPPLTSEKFSKS